MTQRAPTQRSDLGPPRRWNRVLTIGAAVFVAMLSVWLLDHLTPGAGEIPYSDFRAHVRSGLVTEATITGNRIDGVLRAGATGSQSAERRFTTTAPATGDPKLLDDMDAAHVRYSIHAPQGGFLPLVLGWLLPAALILMFLNSAMRRMPAGGLFGVGQSKATEVQPADVRVSYKDVGGADEAIAELREIIQFLKMPQRFAALGGRIPKGVLLVGPPGTGKTLIAKATAGEAGVPFFETGGSEFVEMFVGVGAARVRDLFDHARQAAPAIVFIDEIDAIGQSRGGGVRILTNEEREQTLNQLLAEIDGFKADTAKPVIIMAATNRPEILDPALLRAGRFDRQVVLGNPDLIGREQILRIHTRSVKLDPLFDLERAARVTPGFSGADLANVVNEAALLAARRDAAAVTVGDFEAAMERVVAGLEKRTRVMSDTERRAVACHECGHALLAQLVPHGDPVSKVSIVPRTRGALGYTLQMPAEDRYLLTREELQDRLAVMLGGRAAEGAVFGTVSTGASDDIQRATELARRMVVEFGMSDRLGPVRYAGTAFQYLDAATDLRHVSPHMQELIDVEILRLVSEQEERARDLLQAHRPALDTLIERLLVDESIDGSVVRQALQNAAEASQPAA